MLFVTHPVPVPSPQRSRVVHTNRVDTLDLKAGAFQRAHEEVERSRGISTRENVLVHEQTPDQVLVLPWLAKTGDLQKEDTVVVKHVIDLAQELAEVAHANVLRHLKTGDLLEATLRRDDVTVVVAKDARLLLGNASLAETAVTPGSLVAAKRDTSSVSAVVDRSELGKRTPAAPDVEHGVARLQADLLTDDGQLVVLQLLERLLLIDVGDHARGVDHAWTQEPAIEVVTAVVVVADLLLILRAGVHDHFRHHASKEEPEERQSEAEVGPVMAVLHDLQRIAIELHQAIKVHLVEGLHGNLVPATVLCLVAISFEGEVVLDRCTGVASLLVQARGHGGGDGPEDHQDGDGEENGEDCPCYQTASELPGDVAWDGGQEGEEEEVVEVF